MSNDRSGFIRLQTQSHIVATQWQQWTEALDLEPVAVEDIWDEIGYPVLTATRQLPPIPFILQLRAERRHVDLFEFKDEIAPLLAFLNLFAQLGDDTLGGKAIPVLFRFFRLKVASGVGDHRAERTAASWTTTEQSARWLVSQSQSVDGWLSLRVIR